MRRHKMSETPNDIHHSEVSGRAATTVFRDIVQFAGTALSAYPRDEYVAQWNALNDLRLATLLGTSTTGGSMWRPPISRESRATAWDGLQVPTSRLFAIRHAGAVVGEFVIRGMRWPAASADIGIVLYANEDRGKRVGYSALALGLAYAFGALGLNRVGWMTIAANDAVQQLSTEHGSPLGVRLVGTARDADWAFGRPTDVLIYEVLRPDFVRGELPREIRELALNGGLSDFVSEEKRR